MRTKTADEIIRRYKRGDKEFKGVVIKQGNFSRIRLVGINFEGAILEECNFEKSILQRARFSAANLRGANLRGANLSKADLKGVDFRGATMRAVDLSGADLRWANLEGVDLRGSLISRANFEGANLKNASLKNTDPGRWWWKANLDEAKLDGTILPNGAIFSQPEAITPAISDTAESPPPLTEPAGPDYERASRLYYEGLGMIGTIQTQRESGLPITHPKMQTLLKEAAQKFSEAVAASDDNWSHYDTCNRYISDLLQDIPRDTP